jgi:hypothetical protein
LTVGENWISQRLISGVEVVLIVLVSVGVGGSTGDFHGQGSICGISSSGEDGNKDASPKETHSQTDSESNGNTGGSGLSRGVGHTRSSISVAHSASIDDKDGAEERSAHIGGGGIAQVQDAEITFGTDERTIQAEVDVAINGSAVGVKVGSGTYGGSESGLIIESVSAHLSGSVSGIASVLGAEVSVIAELGLVHQLVDATEVRVFSGHPSDITEIVSARVGISAVWSEDGSAVRIDLEVSVGVVGPSSQSSADVILASVSVALIEDALASELTLSDREAAVSGGCSIVATEFLAGSGDSSFG